MKRFLNKIIDFFDYFFYKSTKTMIFDKEITDKMFAAQCLLCIFLCYFLTIFLWPILGLFAKIVTEDIFEAITGYTLPVVLFLATYERYSDEKLLKRLRKRYRHESHPVLRGILLLLFTVFVIIISLLIAKRFFVVPYDYYHPTPKEIRIYK